MPGFVLTGRTEAAVEDVWKLLFDPTRFPEWWDGVETVRHDAPDTYTQWLAGYPDTPMPQALRTDRTAGRVIVSCQVNDVEVTWQLSGTCTATMIEVRVEVSAAERHRLPGLETMMWRSLVALGALAAEAAPR